MKETTLKRLERIEAELATADDADMLDCRNEFYDIEPDGTLKRLPSPYGAPYDDRPARRVMKVIWTPSDGNGGPAPSVLAYLKRCAEAGDRKAASDLARLGISQQAAAPNQPRKRVTNNERHIR